MMRTINSERIPIYLWLDDIEKGALEQAIHLANLPFAFKHIAIMPDCHQGYGMPIGGVLATREVIIPNAVGVDIGCGMIAVETSLVDIPPDQLKEVLGAARQAIPVGFDHQKDDQAWTGFDHAPDTRVIQEEISSARRQLGTLGGGNHFIEVQKEAAGDGHIWLMIHSGSRNFGYKVARYYHDLAAKMSTRWKSEIPNKDLSCLPMDTVEGQDYFRSMKFCLDFAQANRSLMMVRLVEILAAITGAATLREINIHHNYAAFENHYGRDVLVHRKGATRATSGLTGIIPGSMGTPSYITCGQGNPESFMSSSHGAGRRMGRNEAKRSLDLNAEQAKMKGILHGLRGKRDLDEAPGAYKDIDQVMVNQQDLVRIEHKLLPLASIKG
jgi:tRNA-splicing ligase RtcB